MHRQPYEIAPMPPRPHSGGGTGAPRTASTRTFGDVDNDGRADLFIAKGNVDKQDAGQSAMEDPNNLLIAAARRPLAEAAAAAA